MHLFRPLWVAGIPTTLTFTIPQGGPSILLSLLVICGCRPAAGNGGGCRCDSRPTRGAIACELTPDCPPPLRCRHAVAMILSFKRTHKSQVRCTASAATRRMLFPWNTWRFFAAFLDLPHEPAGQQADVGITQVSFFSVNRFSAAFSCRNVILCYHAWTSKQARSTTSPVRLSHPLTFS